MFSNSNKLAFAVELTESEINKGFEVGYKIIDVRAKKVIFKEPYNQDNGSRWVERKVQISVPNNTKGVFVYIGDHYLAFGDDNETFDRPLTQFGIRHKVESFVGSTVTVSVEADLSDRNADDQWHGEVEVIVVCLF